MNISIKELSAQNEGDYANLIAEVPTSLLYHSLQYRRFLKQILPEARDVYLLAIESGRLMAALPSFVMPGPYGSVVNSLPFYGSNGAIVAKEGFATSGRRALLQAFEKLCQSENAVTSTIVENPLESGVRLLEGYEPDLTDERIGQLTPLPQGASEHDIAEILMSSFHVKTRNLVRKGMKSGFDVGHDSSLQTMQNLHELHESNMNAIGGLAKPWAVFGAIQNCFEYDKHYRVYSAKKDGKTAASLLVFFFNKTAEYFVPVISPEFRSEQPLSCLIFLAMQDMVAKGCKWWNWGGTWLSQEGVYHFKSRWGTKDIRYQYLTKVYSDIGEIQKKTKAEVLEAYRYFYVLPFSNLNVDGK